MPPTSPLYLHKLTLLREIFDALNRGRHLNRLADHKFWVELERELDAYETLFKALGYELRIDNRGFAWFHFDEATGSVSKTTRQLALFFLLLFEYQADAGKHLGRFTDWSIDEALLTALIEKNRQLLEAEGMADRENLGTVLKAAVNYGFAVTEGSSWHLLTAVFRYLDRFEELAHRSEPEVPGAAWGSDGLDETVAEAPVP